MIDNDLVGKARRPLKAVKLEVQILTDASQPNAEVCDWVKDAMHDYCEFEASFVKIIEHHDAVLTSEDGEVVEA